MATFAPELSPVEPPNWDRLYHPVTQPESDKSTGLALDTAATGLTEGVNAIEGAVQSGIKEKVRAGVDALRDTTTLAYEEIRNAQQEGRSPAEAAQRTAGFTGSLVQPGAGEVPPGLQSGIDRADDIGTALAQNTGGKNRETLYNGALNGLAKQLRSQYPGHVDFIDEQMARISGRNPANAYMDSLLSDINANATKKNSDQAILMGKVKDHMGDTDGSGRTTWSYWKNYEAGMPGAEDRLANYLSGLEADQAKFNRAKQKHELNTFTRSDDAEQAKQEMNDHLAAAAYRNYNGILDNAHLTDPATANRLITASQNGQITLTGDQKNNLLSVVAAAKNSYLQEAKKINQQYGYSSRVNDPKAEKEIIANNAANFDNALENITNDHYGSLFESKRTVAAMTDDTEKQVLSNPDVGGYLRMRNAFVKYGGPDWANQVDATGLGKSMLGKFQNFATQATMQSQTPDDLRQDGQVKSLFAHIQQVQQYDAEQKRLGHSGASPAVYNDLVHNVDTISNPKAPPEVKAEVAKYAFNEKNWGLMDAFKKDFTDTNNVQHKGKYSVFDTMTQPGITDNLWNLKNSSVWGEYKNWAETSFGTLYREEIQDMNAMSQTGAAPVRLLWSAKNRMFDMEESKASPIQNPELHAQYMQRFHATISRLNNGLANLGRVQDKEGGDTSEYLLRTMVNLGYSPNEKTGGLPTQMMQAIISSKGKKDLGTAFEKAKLGTGGN